MRIRRSLRKYAKSQMSRYYGMRVMKLHARRNQQKTRVHCITFPRDHYVQMTFREYMNMHRPGWWLREYMIGKGGFERRQAVHEKFSGGQFNKYRLAGGKLYR